MACAPGAASPAAQPSSPAAPAAAKREPWQDDWDKLAEAAKKEGKLNLLGNPGADLRKAWDQFEAFSGIKVELQTFTTEALAIPKITQERDSKVYSFDVAVFTIQGFLSTLKPTGAFDPIRPVIFRPDVTDDKAWRRGFEFGFMDKEKKWVYNHLARVGNQIWVNTDLVKEGEIKTVRDLLDPKWQGKFMFADVRTGHMYVWLAAVRQNVPNADDFIKRLLVDQKPTFTRDTRLIAENMVRGRYAFATGVTLPVLQEFLDQGLGKNLKPMVLPETQAVVTSAGGLWLFNKAPNPNAAKLFINWLLTKEGQTILSKAAKENSRRADVDPYEKTELPEDNRNYFWALQEENIQRQVDVRLFTEKLVTE